MKKFLFILKPLAMAFFIICLAACGKGGKITPTSNKINGPLGKFFEVVEREYKINGDELSVEFKRIAEGGPEDASWSTDPTFLVELQDEDGNAISTKNTDVVLTKDQLESVFSLDVDETASITFRFSKTKGVAQFKVSSKWNTNEESSTSASSNINGTHDMRGTIDKYQITMQVSIDGTSVKGSYYYDKQGPSAVLSLSGTNEDGILDINETDANGTPTGHFKGKFLEGVFKGIFVTNQGKKMSFLVAEDGATDGDFTFDDVSSFDDDNDLSMESNDYTSGDGDASIDEFLDEYERFWRKYMDCMRKVEKNDPTALVEYAQLMKEYYEYGRKLEQVKGNLSMDQLNRINKMNAEMMSEMQKME